MRKGDLRKYTSRRLEYGISVFGIFPYSAHICTKKNEHKNSLVWPALSVFSMKSIQPKSICWKTWENQSSLLIPILFKIEMFFLDCRYIPLDIHFVPALH